MHHFNGKGSYINYNGDLSGEVYITDKNTGVTITLLGQDVLDFMAGFVTMDNNRELDERRSAAD